MKSLGARWRDHRSAASYQDRRSDIANKAKALLLKLFRIVVFMGISYVILAPVIGIVSRSFFSDADQYNPMVFTIPVQPTLLRYQEAVSYMNYWVTAARTLLYTLSLTLLQLLVCSMVGYGFARFRFPLKKLWFACVVVMIVVPPYTIQVPLYTTFRNFNPLGLVGALTKLFTGKSQTNWMGTTWPVYLMTALGCGLRSGLYIYIFNQFFRGLPREIEEAAFVDGAGTWYTYFRIMLVNAVPAVITVSVFSIVWQYNDTFYANLFQVPSSVLVSKQLATLQNTITNAKHLYDPAIARLYVDAGVVLVMVPIVLIYLLLQRRFIEGVERSGIVG